MRADAGIAARSVVDAMTVIFPDGSHIEFREAPNAAVVAQIVGLLTAGRR